MSSTYAGRGPFTELGKTVTMALLALAAGGACSRTRTVGDSARAGQTGTQDTAFASMQERGRNVMGVDQYKSSHTFEDLADGGRIELVSDVGTDADVSAIRGHLKEIARQFKAGDFTNPAIVHAGAVPGTDVLARKAAVVKYSYADRPRGGEVRIVTTDAEALDAVKRFLAYQRSAHHTHDMTRE